MKELLRIDKVYNPLTGKKKYIILGSDIPEGYIIGLPIQQGKRIQTPYGIFLTISECAKNLNITRYDIGKYLKKDSSQWYILNEEVINDKVKDK